MALMGMWHAKAGLDEVGSYHGSKFGNSVCR